MSIVRTEVRDGVAILTIDRPEALNALNEAVLIDLEEAVEAAAADPSVLSLIVTGAGKAFVAGADIAGMSTMDEGAGYRFGQLGQRVFRRIETLEKPTIAAVNGFALGGGCELAMACDIRIAGERAKFGQPEVGLGITPGYSGTQRLPRIVGKARAMELILTGDIIGAAEAAAIGLVNRVVPQEALLDEALALAAKINRNAPLAVRYSKKAIVEGLDCADLDEAIEVEAVYFGRCFSTADQKEGMGAFLEKRKPDFRGK